MKNGFKILIFLIIILIGSMSFYFLAPLRFIINLDQTSLNLFFIGVLGFFLIMNVIIQEGIGRDKESKKVIKKAKEVV
ncbi:MAG: hypothetical protein ACTSQP_23330 [Promethearchaeota archaeon]